MNCDRFSCPRRFFRHWSLLRLGSLVAILVLVAGCGSSGGNSDTTAPAAPTGLTGAAGDSKVDLSWDGVGAGDLETYRIYRSTSSPVEISNQSPTQTTEKTTYTDTGVQNETIYYYVVTVVDDAGNESASSNEIEKQPPFDSAPGRP
jgi:fibronectin type 3 domain-containing protein